MGDGRTSARGFEAYTDDVRVFEGGGLYGSVVDGHEDAVVCADEETDLVGVRLDGVDEAGAHRCNRRTWHDGEKERLPSPLESQH